jgi:hypothetical protein
LHDLPRSYCMCAAGVAYWHLIGIGIASLVNGQGEVLASVVSRAKLYNMIWVWYDALHVGKQRSFSCHG